MINYYESVIQWLGGKRHEYTCPFFRERQQSKDAAKSFCLSCGPLIGLRAHAYTNSSFTNTNGGLVVCPCSLGGKSEVIERAIALIHTYEIGG